LSLTKTKSLLTRLLRSICSSNPSSTLLLSSFFHSPPISRRHQSPPPPPPLAAVVAADPVSWSLQFPNMLHLLEKSALLVSFNCSYLSGFEDRKKGSIFEGGSLV
ncbi:hypothetical protein Droror1_Dr00025388, partial [Drosera rotundifolia]